MKTTYYLLGLFLFLNAHHLWAQCGAQSNLIDSRDGQTYNIVQIDGNSTPYCLANSQCWMSENLNIGTFVSGVTTQTSGPDNQNTSIEKHCYGDVNPGNCDTYGGLYQWNEMMAYGSPQPGNGPGPQGICPQDWHIPTDNEWKCLEMNIGMSQAQADGAAFYRGATQGDQLKVTSSHSPAWNGTNTVAFDALPAGDRRNDGQFFFIGTTSYFWTASEDAASNPWHRAMWTSATGVYRDNNFARAFGFSVRCIRDNAPWPLPIELLYFKAYWTDNSYETATLDWETISETNNAFFEIERSIDGINFEFVKSIPGNGNSSENISYTTLDESPYTNGISYYRLKQVDGNGDFKYSNIEALNVPEGLSLIKLYPNPVKNQFTVLTTSSVSDELTIRITDHLGRVVRELNQDINQGFNSMIFDVTDFSTGNYIIEMTTSSNLYHIEHKFIKSND